MSNEFEFDYIIIGSGFGGSVMFCRLVEKGYKVCLLERGKEYNMQEFPRRMNEIHQNLFWGPNEGKFGIMEILDFKNSDIVAVAGAGLGGGSLIYANVLYKMPAQNFISFPKFMTSEIYEPLYNKVINMMEASPYPIENKLYNNTPKYKLLKNVANSLPDQDYFKSKPEFETPDLAIRFKGNFLGEQSFNNHGKLQSNCTMCGECDIGCNIHAKNSLDHNYLYRGKKLGGTIKTESEVENIIPFRDGYRLDYFNYRTNKLETLTTHKTIVSAGSLGSTKLLLKMKMKKILPNISNALGSKWCGNGDLEGTVFNCTEDVMPTLGPVITSAIKFNCNDYEDGMKHNFVIQDAGYPIGLAWYLMGKTPSLQGGLGILKISFYFLINKILKIVNKKKNGLNITHLFSSALEDDILIRKNFVLLAMGKDRSDGEVSLDKDGDIYIKWNHQKSELHIKRAREQMSKIANALGGKFVDNPLTYLDKYVAVHPLGGCPIGETDKDGVVDYNAEVFGHKGLFVIDGSILPSSIGVNPALTIAATAELLASKIISK